MGAIGTEEIKTLEIPLVVESSCSSSINTPHIIDDRDKQGDDHHEHEHDVDRIFSKLSLLPSHSQHPELMERCRPIIDLWHDTFACTSQKDGTGAQLWKKMRRNIPKELNESAFILNEMMHICNEYDGDEPLTIIDMCSGVGYLSMFLSHLLPSEMVSRIIPIDVLFAAHNDKGSVSSSSSSSTGTSAVGVDNDVNSYANTSRPITDSDVTNNDQALDGGEMQTEKPQINHLSTDHLLSPIHPIPIRPRRANIKKGRELRQISKHCIAKAPGPVIILGVHLCKSLSVHTVRLFNSTTTKASRLYLKPCCLPGRKDLRRREPPFWEFEGMRGGGFGVKTLYCEVIDSTTKDSEQLVVVDLAEAKREARLIVEAEGETEVDAHAGARTNSLFTKWVRLLRDAADSGDGVSANINYCSVQLKHFQNQFIVATR